MKAFIIIFLLALATYMDPISLWFDAAVIMYFTVCYFLDSDKIEDKKREDRIRKLLYG